MVFAAEYPFLNLFGTMILFFAWGIWFWMMIGILTDVFRRPDLSGLAKAAWTIFLLVLPFVGALIYLVSNHDGMAEREIERTRAARTEFDGYVKSVATNGDGPAGEIDKGKRLLDSGAINQSEFDAIKAKALA